MSPMVARKINWVLLVMPAVALDDLEYAVFDRVKTDNHEDIQMRIH